MTTNMTNNEHLFSLSAVSATDILCIKDSVYKTDEVKQYLKSLDASAGKRLFDICSEIYPGYFEVVRDRKFGVFTFADDVLQNSDISQVVIAGCGLDPLSLEIKSKCNNVDVFDLDIHDLSVKKDIIASMEFEYLKEIKFVNTDISNADYTKQQLLKAGWKSDMPTLLIVEGVSYFLEVNPLKRLMSLFSCEGKSRVILEYLLPEENIDEQIRFIPEKIFGVLAAEANLDTITCLSQETIYDWEELALLKVLNIFSIKNQRFGGVEKNFNGEGGWIEIALLGC